MRRKIKQGSWMGSVAKFSRQNWQTGRRWVSAKAGRGWRRESCGCLGGMACSRAPRKQPAWKSKEAHVARGKWARGCWIEDEFREGTGARLFNLCHLWFLLWVNLTSNLGHLMPIFQMRKLSFSEVFKNVPRQLRRTVEPRFGAKFNSQGCCHPSQADKWLAWGMTTDGWVPSQGQGRSWWGSWHGGDSEVHRMVSETGGIPPLTPSDGVP